MSERETGRYSTIVTYCFVSDKRRRPLCPTNVVSVEIVRRGSLPDSGDLGVPETECSVYTLLHVPSLVVVELDPGVVGRWTRFGVLFSLFVCLSFWLDEGYDRPTTVRGPDSFRTGPVTVARPRTRTGQGEIAGGPRHRTVPSVPVHVSEHTGVPRPRARAGSYRGSSVHLYGSAGGPYQKGSGAGVATAIQSRRF